MNIARVEEIGSDGAVRTLLEAARAESAGPVDGAALVSDIEGFLGRFIVLPAHTVLPLALWTIATFTFESFDAFPYLAITSPTKRCGKTRLLECLELLAHGTPCSKSERGCSVSHDRKIQAHASTR